MSTRRVIHAAGRATLALLAALAAAIVLCSCQVSPERYRAMKDEIELVDVSTLADGNYEGHASLFPVDVKVELGVRGGRLVSLELVKHFNGQGQAAEILVDTVLETQSLDVDVVAGATHSSITILKAIEDAMKKGATL
ncbi:MAG: FMN-binding protein [Spirochaetia bacterium]|nr:FMN-binding protein [Spirochaetia bacterium]